YKDTQQALTDSAVQTPYGLLPPIYPGYAPLPLTLSVGPAKPDDLSDELWRAYLENKSVVIPDDTREPFEQNLRENTYANYRYYLEMVSSGGLPSEMAQAIARLRADRGGVLLGMTRFSGWLDDWPVAEWAKYLLSVDRLSRYWMLLYAHLAHHQNRDTLTAYEQVRIDGKYRAGDCLPSQLVAPRMLAWSFAFEFPGDEHLYLLRGIPSEWYQPGSRFGWENMPTAAGVISIQAECEKRSVEVVVDLSSLNENAKPVIQLNLAEPSKPRDIRKSITVYDGSDFVEKIEDNRVYIRPGKKGKVRLTIKR
ncbi:MAG: hypothetical protein ACP5I1_09070, partial [Candidatus Hinthialibacter sp.]